MKIFPVVQQLPAAHRRNPAKPQNPPHHQSPKASARWCREDLLLIEVSSEQRERIVA
jgi:hypothetical protein